jgi:serine/threonine-protein kinase
MAQVALPKGSIGGRYEVQKWIGAGGMQNVFAARDQVFDRLVALKMPKGDAAIKRFQNSAIVSARVNHVNVAKTLDYFEDEQGNYLIEELIEGVDLSQLFPGILSALPPSASARMLHQLAKGLCASHDAGVIHRDLKPSNIMIAGGAALSNVKITDFGIAKMAEAEIAQWADTDAKGSTSSKTVLGAIPYMAPESIADFKNASFPSDVWGIAAICYELLSGKKPFGGGLASVAKILNAAPPPKPTLIAGPQFQKLGDELYEIILSCLTADPAQRPTAAQLARRMEDVFYSVDAYELGTISKVPNAYWGFISADSGRDLMYHRDSFYGAANPKVGERVWYGRHPGQGNDRAFPIVKVKPPAA